MAGIYLHIPFCKQACTYCNFHFSTSLKQKDALLDALCRELIIRSPYLEGQKVETVYFGGGTPSLLEAAEISRIMDCIFAHYETDGLKECTLEANPDDMHASYLRALRHTPVSRLSVGIQSFRDADLRYMHRAHSATQAYDAVRLAQDLGFSNLTADLIYGIPGLDDRAWKEALLQMKRLDIPHFSAYALTVETGTRLYHDILRERTAPVDQAQSAAQFRILMQESAAMGYEQYEISNFCVPGSYALHNTSYWQGTPYLGIGPSAHSFNGRERSWNISNNAVYIRHLLRNEQPPSEAETLSEAEQLNEYIMTSLRTQWGCNLERVSTTWGINHAGTIRQQAEKHITAGWMIIRNGVLLLTPEGKLFADRIASELFF